jgi:hypothetical protein
VGDAGTITPRVDVNYQSSFFSNIDNNPLAKVDGYAIANGRLTFEDASRDWQFSVSVTNMFNKFYYLNKIRYPIGIVVGAASPAARMESQRSSQFLNRRGGAGKAPPCKTKTSPIARFE